MKVKIEDTLEQYKYLFKNNINREDYYRYEMMKPFKNMWNTINVPLKSTNPNGYDVIMASKMLGYLDLDEVKRGLYAINELEKINALKIADDSLHNCINFIEKYNLKINAQELLFGLYLADPEKLELQKGYCGFGGIPGFIHISIYPNDYNIPRLPAIIAHEFHHNIRFSYFDWDNGNVTVGDYIIIEGLAESFSKELYGEKLLGPWVTSFEDDDLKYSLEVIKDALNVKGFSEVSSYMFGDEIAIKQGFQPVGLSPFAGYAVGYHIVQSFMKLNNVNISEATLMNSEDIINQSGLL